MDGVDTVDTPAVVVAGGGTYVGTIVGTVSGTAAIAAAPAWEGTVPGSGINGYWFGAIGTSPAVGDAGLGDDTSWIVLLASGVPAIFSWFKSEVSGL